MKNSVKTAVSVLLAAGVVCSLSSCTLFSSVRKRVEEANNTTLAETPEEESIISHFNGLLANSVERAEKITEKTEYSLNGLNIEKADGSDADALGKSADILKKLTAEKNPGRTEREITDKQISDTLLADVETDMLLDCEFSRNTRTVNVTEENGKEVSNENGENVTEIKITDNILKTVFKYFKDIADENGTTAEPAEGETAAEPTTRVFADDSVITAVFGEQADRDAVLAHFECIKNYVTVTGYEIKNGSCQIRSDIELTVSELSDVEFCRPMTVTAHVKGVGSLEKYGDLTVTLEIEKRVTYSFSYAVETTAEAE